MMEITPDTLAKMYFLERGAACCWCRYHYKPNVPPLLNSGRTELVGYCLAHTLASDKEAVLREEDVGH